MSMMMMSLCICVVCGHEAYIPCCVEQGIYYSYCKPCILEANFQGLDCFKCHKSISNKVYCIQKKLLAEHTRQQPPFMAPHLINCEANRDSRVFNEAIRNAQQTLPQQLLPPNMSSRSTSSRQQPFNGYVSSPWQKQGNGGNFMSKSWQATEEDFRLADEALDAPLNCEPWLRKERKKNNLPDHTKPPSPYNCSPHCKPIPEHWEDDDESDFSTQSWQLRNEQ